MSERDKAILAEANAAIVAGDNEGFLAFCADDTEWMFIGDITLKGKEAVRRWMEANYAEPPKFTVARMIAEGDFVVALGDIVTKGKDGVATSSSYCDVWRFRGDKIVGLQAFVIPDGAEDETGRTA
jgi:ketosteroid isomerase-like protein